MLLRSGPEATPQSGGTHHGLGESVAAIICGATAITYDIPHLQAIRNVGLSVEIAHQ
jgi:hypothetical protein